MSKEVKRYDHAGDHCGPRCGFEEVPDGDWIRASDYDALLAERDRLRDALVTARDWIDFSKGAVGGGYLILEEVDAALQGAQP